MRLKTALLATTALFVYSCSGTNIVAESEINKTGETGVTGTAIFINENNKLRMVVEIKGMQNKTHAVHIHEIGECGDEGRAAAGHWNPTKENHGRWGINVHHSGDIGNINTDSNGYGKITVVDTSNRWSIGGSKNTSVIGRSIIVHANTDDGTSQPTGNAGGRVGCGVIKKP